MAAADVWNPCWKEVDMSLTMEGCRVEVKKGDIRDFWGVKRLFYLLWRLENMWSWLVKKQQLLDIQSWHYMSATSFTRLNLFPNCRGSSCIVEKSVRSNKDCYSVFCFNLQNHLLHARDSNAQTREATAGKTQVALKVAFQVPAVNGADTLY